MFGLNIFYAFIVSSLLLFSCSTKNKKPAEHPPKELNLAFTYEPLTIDPRKNSDPATCQFINLIYEGLIHLEPDGSLSFGAVKSIDIAKNRTKFVFHLRDTFWSDGHPVTAHDFVYSWKSVLDPSFNSRNTYFFYSFKNAAKAKKGLTSLDKVGIYAQDNKTLIVKLETPAPYFLEMLAFCTFYPVPKHIFENNLQRGLDEPEKIVTNGPFCLKKWQHNNTIELQKNPYFWNSNVVDLETIKISIIPEPATILNLFEKGQVDFIGTDYAPIPLDSAVNVKDQYHSITKEFAGTELCFFNNQTYPLDNLNIRKALYYSIDRSSIVKNILKFNETVAFGLIPPIYKNHKVTKFLANGSTDLAKHYFAKGLKEVGITAEEFPKLSLCYYENEADSKIAQVLQEYWKNTLGIEVQLKKLDIKTFLEKLTRKNFHLCLMSIFSQYFDPYNYFERFLYSESNKNYSCWENLTYQHLIEISNEKLPKKERSFLLDKAEALLLSELPCGPIYHFSQTYLKHPDLTGIKICPLGSVDFKTVSFKANKS